MARLDELDKYYERIEEGRRNLEAAHEPIRLPPPTEGEVERWTALQLSITDQIRGGELLSDHWKIAPPWIEVRSGEFSGRSFKLDPHLPLRSDGSRIDLPSSIGDDIRRGATSGNCWKVVGSVVVTPIGELPLSIPLPRITDIRVANYLEAHGLSPSLREVQSLRGAVFDLSDEAAKAHLKAYIIKQRSVIWPDDV